MSQIRISPLLLASVLAIGVEIAPATAQSLRDSVSMAVSGNPKVGVITTNRQAVEQELVQARGLYFPQVDLRAAVGPEYTDSPTTRARGKDGVVKARRDLSLIIQQRLFDGFEADSEVERQQARVRSAAGRVRETVEFLGLDAVETHVDIIRQRRLYNLAEANVEVHRSMLDRVSQRVAGGAGTSADVNQARARLEQAQATLVETRGALREAEARYMSIVGNAPGTLDPAPYPAAAMPKDLEAALEQLRQRNPTVGISQSDIDVADAQVRSAESRFWPKVNLELAGAKNNDVEGVSGRDDSASAQVVLRWNLYRGGADVANRREALGRAAQARSTLLQTLRESEEQMRRAWAGLESLSDRVDLLRNSVRLNEQVRDAYTQQFEVGVRSLLDVLDAENELFVSSARLATTEQAMTFAAYKVLAVEGALLSTLEVSLPQEADPNQPAPVPQPIQGQKSAGK